MTQRNERSRESILRATMSPLDGGECMHPLTLRDLTIERIAREARVSKTSIYRWWPNKTALVVDTLRAHDVWWLTIRDDIPAIDALRSHLSALATMYAGRPGRPVAQLIAECQYEPDALDELKSRFWDERSAAVLGLIERHF